MKYLITGTAGFIGYHTAKRLLENNNEIIGIDNINDFYDINLKNARLKELSKHENFNFYNTDLTNKSDVLNLQNENKIDAVIHLAAYAGVRTSLSDPWAYQENNVTATLNLLELCKISSIKNFTLASTSSVYGDNKTLPTNETIPTSNPLSPYAASKISAELLAYNYHYHYGINTAILRFFTVYGPFGRPDMVIFKFIKLILENKPITIYGDGKSSRDYTYVTDVSDALIASTKLNGYEIFNVGGGSATTLDNLVKIIESLLEKKAIIQNIPRDPSDVEHSLADITKISKILNWQPKYNIEQGVRETGKWFLDNLDFISSINLKD